MLVEEHLVGAHKSNPEGVEPFQSRTLVPKSGLHLTCLSRLRNLTVMGGAAAIEMTVTNRGLASHSMESIRAGPLRTAGPADRPLRIRSEPMQAWPHFGENILRRARTPGGLPEVGLCSDRTRGRALVCGSPASDRQPLRLSGTY
jgi:hypothetical protein